MLQTIVYTSRATLPDGADPNAKPVWLDSLVEHAVANNKVGYISGVLSYKAGKFIHLIRRRFSASEKFVRQNIE